MKHITCIEDLRQVHMRKVPKAFFDYADRGSYAEDTLRANREDLERIKFRQRILVDVSKRDLSTTILGEPAALPLILAPVGLLGMHQGADRARHRRELQRAGPDRRFAGDRTAPSGYQERHDGAAGMDPVEIAGF